ncbi:OTU deubiquitinase with linear linkage specificity a [Parambassis ranga]|uniref:OTU deubiquitinase with linear linkage specificity a n=1 Tax=Parambassis ranga TaxID=210632 RepID=A0A6P7KHV5_9TELE|nr:protein YAE1 homolog [Parambassis ranga]
MSWVKAMSSSGEDVFDENADELGLLSKEWASNMKKRIRDGYVDGIDAGEEASLQLGFNLGFKEGAKQTMAVSRLRGIVSAISCWCQTEHPENPIPASVIDLLQQVTQHEEQIAERIRNTLTNPPPSVSDISENMEDLEVEQTDPGCCGGKCKESGCCKGAAKMDLDHPRQPSQLCSGSTGCSTSSDEGALNALLQRCMDLVSEMGLPMELLGHIQELKDM